VSGVARFEIAPLNERRATEWYERHEKPVDEATRETAEKIYDAIRRKCFEGLGEQRSIEEIVKLLRERDHALAHFDKQRGGQS
jgi:hypothetical protein